jgi:hypothetical protein
MPMHEDPEASVTITILDMDNEPIADEITYSVSKFSKDSSDGSMLLIGIVAVVILLIVAVVVVLIVLNRTEDAEEFEYIEEDDFLPAAEAVTPVQSRGPPATRPGERRGPPGSSRGPPAAAKSPMEIAKEKFPFWDDATIQGYFDQGWNVEQLEEWLASQE